MRTIWLRTTRLWLGLGICFLAKLSAQIPLSPPDQRLPLVFKAQCLAADAQGNLALLDREQRQLGRWSNAPYYDQFQRVGGAGTRNEGLLAPVSVAFSNRQRLYLLDESTRRIVLFDVNLRIVQEIDFLSNPALEELLPVAFAVSPTDELYVLNAQDNKVYKFDGGGRVQLTFGGLDYGPGALLNPSGLAVTADRRVWVADSLDQTLYVFNPFGAFERLHRAPVDMGWSQLRATGQTLLYFSDKELLLEHLPTQRHRHLRLPEGVQLRDAAWVAGQLFLLTESEIWVVK